MQQHKLYTFTSPDFQVYSHLSQEDRTVTIPADNIPMLRWPDGRWCWLANVYIGKLYDKGRSRKDEGGTLKTYATQLSHLIRFCFSNRTDFTELTDDQFSLFIKWLYGERRPFDNARIREAGSVIAIGRLCLDFLNSVAATCGIDNFVGPEGQIIAEQREFHIFSSGSHARPIVRRYWHHRSFPTSDPRKRRLPIDGGTLTKLQDAVVPASGSIYLRKRRYVMLRLLEITGARRSEVARLTVDSVLEAADMDRPMLKLTTMKKGGNKEYVRFVPILRHDIEFLKEFIEKNRRLVVKKTCGLSHDQRFVLVSETTGERLRSNTITQEIRMLRLQAKVATKACAHMFRHRFITKLFVALIEQHEIQNTDDFRKALLDNEQLKQEVREITGHTRLESLDQYIHLAFAEITNFRKSVDMASAKQLIQSLVSSLRQVQYELKKDSSTIESVGRVDRFLSSALDDLHRLSHQD